MVHPKTILFYDVPRDWLELRYRHRQTTLSTTRAAYYRTWLGHQRCKYRRTLCFSRSRLLRAGFQLRQQLLEIVPAAERVDVRLLQLVGLAPTGADGVADGVDGLVRERGGLGRRHAGVRFPSQPGQ